jgi:hypothetical protein
MVVLGGGALSYERGTLVPLNRLRTTVPQIIIGVLHRKHAKNSIEREREREGETETKTET